MIHHKKDSKEFIGQPMRMRNKTFVQCHGISWLLTAHRQLSLITIQIKEKKELRYVTKRVVSMAS